MKSIEKFLLSKKFRLETYYQTNKKYVLPITDCQNLYVRIYSDANKIVEVEYENIPMTEHECEGKISFESIDTLKKLKHLIKSLI